jgi:RNA polymerase sigma factor (sigma-70 family)
MDSRRNLGKLVERLRVAAVDPAPSEESDGQLLLRFRRECDAAALEQLIRRHGRVVLLACRRQLRESHDVEDCFQAVWLILARKAGSIRRPELLASWLYGVARRTAIQTRHSASRRRAREAQAARPEAVPPDSRAELWEVLDRELARLPHIYRTAVLLCDVEGCDYKQAARQLGWPEGTLAGRLARGRRLLARRLAQQGIALTAAALTQALAAPADASLSAALAVLTADAAAVFAGAPGSLTDLVSSRSMQLAQEVLRIMHFTKLRIAAILVAIAMAAGIGGSLIPYLGGSGPALEARAGDGPGAAEPAAQPGKGNPPAPAPERPVRPEDKLAAVVSVDFKDVPLREAVEYLRKRTGLNVVVEWKALQEAGVEKDDPVTLQLDKAPLRTVLRHLQRRYELGYYFDGGVLVLTTGGAADEKMIRRVYPVADLVAADPKGENLIEVIVKITGSNGWQQTIPVGPAGGAGGLGGLGGFGGVIGGPGAVVYFAEGRSLVVVQSTRGHEEVAELLEELRASRPAQKSK